MGRPRTPTNVLEARGAFKKNPQRMRNREPEPITELGEPPAHLFPLERAAWEEIAAIAHAGMFCAADRLAVEQAAMLLGQARETVTHPDGTISRAGLRSGDRGLLLSLFARFGMTPADRSKVEVPKAPVVNPFTLLRNRK